jgi:hypothetical protein
MGKTFAIFGSCVTRDAFELDQAKSGGHRVGTYLARTTINSCLSAPVPFKNLFAAERRPKFEERCVTDDILKRHFDALAEKPFDCLIVDLIDERHPVIVIDGSQLCYSVPFRRMADGFAVDTSTFEKRMPQDPRVVEETLANIPRFIERLTRVVDPQRIILHEALWATSFIAADGARRDFPKKAEIERTNAILAAYYARLKSAAPLRVIALADELRVADEKHRWTLEPFHYADIYYRAFMVELDRITQPTVALAASG